LFVPDSGRAPGSGPREALDTSEAIEGHIRFHVLPPETAAADEQTNADDDLRTALCANI